MSRLDDARNALQEYEKTRPAAYQSKYNDQIADVHKQITNMGEFDYDPDADTAYQQYKNEYTKNAKLANRNAQASASAMTGGYGSSYGTQAGQKAYAATMSNLDNVLDGLYNQSLAEYNTKKNGLNDQLSALQSAEKQARSEYDSNYSQWEDGLQYRQNEYDSAYNEHQQSVQTGTSIFGTLLSLGAMILPFFL